MKNLPNEIEAKKQYSFLKKSGVLIELFPNFSGLWKVDKEHFIKEFKSVNNILSNLK